MNAQTITKPFADFEKIERTFFFKRLLNDEQKSRVQAAKDEDEKKVMVAQFIGEIASKE